MIPQMRSALKDVELLIRTVGAQGSNTLTVRFRRVNYRPLAILNSALSYERMRMGKNHAIQTGG